MPHVVFACNLRGAENCVVNAAAGGVDAAPADSLHKSFFWGVEEHNTVEFLFLRIQQLVQLNRNGKGERMAQLPEISFSPGNTWLKTLSSVHLKEMHC